MDQVLRQKWIDALRGGKYRQTTGALRTKDNEGKISYCCLGVLCNIASNKKWQEVEYIKNIHNEKIWGMFDPNPRDYVDDSKIESSHIPTDLTDKFGIGFENQRELAKLNDELKYDFNQIADWVEENL